MARRLEGAVTGAGLRIGIGLARFNEAVTTRLLAGALEALAQHGVAEDTIDVASVPGAFELPLCVQRLAATGRYDGLIGLGAVIRGGTPHFDYVAGWATDGLGRVALRADLPVAFGLLTTDTLEQALARAGGEHGNKGYDAATTVLEMIALLHTIQRA